MVKEWQWKSWSVKAARLDHRFPVRVAIVAERSAPELPEVPEIGYYNSAIAIMTKYTAYFDASGSPDDTIAVVCAGFVAPDDQWVEFNRNWSDCLRDFGVSALHMRHFAHSFREFATWKGDEDRRRRFLGRLISIVKTRVWHSFASAVVMEDYRRVDTKYRLAEFSKPYTLAGGTCVAKLYRWKKRWARPDDAVSFVFEDGDKDKGDLMRALREYGIEPKFLKKEDAMAFQAADLLAYEHLLVNVKVIKAKPDTVSENRLRYPLLEMSTIPGGRNGDDWGVHLEDDMTESCIKDGIALRVP
jgi:hypothetical protein